MALQVWQALVVVEFSFLCSALYWQMVEWGKTASFQSLVHPISLVCAEVVGALPLSPVRMSGSHMSEFRRKDSRSRSVLDGRGTGLMGRNGECDWS